MSILSDRTTKILCKVILNFIFSVLEPEPRKTGNNVTELYWGCTGTSGKRNARFLMFWTRENKTVTRAGIFTKGQTLPMLVLVCASVLNTYVLGFLLVMFILQ